MEVLYREDGGGFRFTDSGSLPIVKDFLTRTKRGYGRYTITVNLERTGRGLWEVTKG